MLTGGAGFFSLEAPLVLQIEMEKVRRFMQAAPQMWAICELLAIHSSAPDYFKECGEVERMLKLAREVVRKVEGGTL